MPANLRYTDRPPARAPKRVARTLFAAQGTVQLTVTVSAVQGISAMSFGFDAAPVAMSHLTGTFNATPGRRALLEWVMIGTPGGTMKVVVTRADGTVVAARATSTIVPPYGEGYDALEIVL